MIPLFKPYIAPKSEIFAELSKVLDSGYLAEGETVWEFERKLGEFLGCSNVLATNSCTSALKLALEVVGVGPGDEVISTPMTAVPTNLAIYHTGAKIVWADVDRWTGNINWDDALRKVTLRTKAVVCVDYGGALCHDRAAWRIPSHVSIIEDAAHAFMPDFWSKNESYASFVTFSFQAIKHINTGDGGALVTCHRWHEERARRLRWFGFDRQSDISMMEQDITVPGGKSHMNNLTAAFGLAQLRHAGKVIDKYIDNGSYFLNGLRDWAGGHFVPSDAYWLGTIVCQDSAKMSEVLTEAGIGNSRAHRRNDEYTIFKDSKTHLPGLDVFYSRMLHIPCGWWLTERDREHIVETILGA